jgi:hypothetical protein
MPKNEKKQKTMTFSMTDEVIEGKVAESDEAVANEINEALNREPEPEIPPPPRKRGRPRKKAEPAPEPKIELTAEQLLPLVSAPFTILARIRGPHWELTPDEATMLANAAVPVANKYMDRFKYWEETALAIVVLAIVAPRLEAERKGQQPAESKSPSVS